MQDQPIGFLFRFILSKSYKKANLIISQTQEMKNEISKYHFSDPEKIKVIQNPVNKKLITSKLKGVTTPFSDDHINIVAAGRLTKQKGFDTLIKAFSIVNKVDSKFKLSILGGFEGEQADELKTLAIELGLADTVSFLGFKSNPYQYFKYADSYVLSSRWEGLPNTVLECLYFGTSVISTNCIPVMEELISDGINGFIVDVDNVNQLGDAILKCQKIVNLNNDEPLHEIDINRVFLEIVNKDLG
jgi:glycosyltransferase involved in cell wall biosynthesis